jgi:TolB-like protein
MKFSLRALFLLIFVVSIGYTQYSTHKTLAIPIFKNNSGNPQYDWLNEALSDMLTTDISVTNKIRVVARSELKEILNEQKLSLSGLVNENSQVTLGNLVGASTLVYGSYTIIGDNIRIDIKSFDVEKGVVEGANTIQGKLSEVLFLEKKIALQTMQSLKIDLSEEDKIKLSQFASENYSAIESNYKGVIALDQDNTKTAESYFKQAVDFDPYYRKASENFETTSSLLVSGEILFSDIIVELSAKDSQREALERIISEFIDNYWIVEINGKPKSQTTVGNNHSVDLTIPLMIKVNHDAIKKYINSLQRISAGATQLEYIAENIYYNNQEFTVYTDNWKWLKEKYKVNGVDHDGIATSFKFEKSFNIVLLSGENKIAKKGFSLSRYTIYGKDISKPPILVRSEKVYDIFRDLPVSTNLKLNNIPLDMVKEITSVEIR